jgi:hypothetical protein
MIATVSERESENVATVDDAADADVLGSLPAPAVIHRRLGEVLREERLLRRLLRLAMAAWNERQRRQVGMSDKTSA